MSSVRLYRLDYASQMSQSESNRLVSVSNFGYIMTLLHVDHIFQFVYRTVRSQSCPRQTDRKGSIYSRAVSYHQRINFYSMDAPWASAGYGYNDVPLPLRKEALA